MDGRIKRLRVRTTIRAGQPAQTAQTTNALVDRAMFVLLDILQKPTDWAYNAICQAPARKP
jgi:hypothetical protein